jgi:hypothetical protein
VILVTAGVHLPIVNLEVGFDVPKVPQLKISFPSLSLAVSEEEFGGKRIISVRMKGIQSWS